MGTFACFVYTNPFTVPITHLVLWWDNKEMVCHEGGWGLGGLCIRWEASNYLQEQFQL